MQNLQIRESGRAAARAVVLAAVVALGGGGCGLMSRPKPMATEQFVSRSAVAAPARASNDNTAAARPASAVVAASGPRDSRPPVPEAIGPSAVAAPAATPTPGPAADPRPNVGASSGQFLVLGGVVAEVNGAPIYANKVLSLIDRALQEKAKQLNPGQFQEYAMGQIGRQVQELIQDELEFAAAQHNSEADDKRIADAITQMWRKQKITEAGGSIQIARKKAFAETGQDFDELTQQQFRTNTVRIYYERKFFPRIQVTAQDMRRYYQRVLEKEFTKHDSARYRIVQVNVGEGGRAEALSKAKSILERARRGDDFAVIASKENDSALLASRAGFPMKPDEFYQRNTFNVEKVEDEVWKLQPGEVGDLVDNGNAFYVVKLEQRQKGEVKPFEDPAVQERIRNTLRAEQFRALHEGVQQQQMKGAIVRVNDQMLSTALLMAMQKYTSWASAK